MNIIAKALLESRAVHIEPNEDNFFTWTSGKKSPIYCNNRQLISFPEFRKQVTAEFVKIIRTNFSNAELIAGTSTAGIPWAAWIAHELELPMVYIRSKAKGHGLKSAIEGNFSAGQKTLIIEDLISTGKSSIEALNHCRTDRLEALSILSIFTYGFQEGINKFKAESISHTSLCNLDQLLNYAKNQNLLTLSDVQTVTQWKSSFI